LQTGFVLLAVMTVGSIQWAPATSQAAEPAKAAAPLPSTDPTEESETVSTSRALTAPPADVAARSQWLTRELDAVIAAHPLLATASIGAQVYDLSTDTALWQRQSEAPMSLASTAKLFTSAAALRALGPGYVWRTALYCNEVRNAASGARDSTIETLYLRGRGDPTLDLAGLRVLATNLADLGIRRISREIVLDATFFDSSTEPPHFGDQPKEAAAFRAPVSALSVNRNSVTVVVKATPEGGPSIRLDPPVGEYVKIVADELVSTPDGKTRIRIEVTPKQDRLELKISGQLNADGPPFYRRIRIDDPLAFAGAALRMALAERGIRSPSRVLNGPVPTTAKLLVAIDSPPLGEVVRRMNKFSDNFLAETVFKTLGAQQRTGAGPASWSDAVTAMRAYLDSLVFTGTGVHTIRLDNGSGLFDASSASAAQLVTVLRSSHRDFRFAPDFLASLPIGGVDGTLQSRFANRTATALVRAKTGTLASASTLAGYVGTDTAHLIAFAVLLNGLQPVQRGPARALQEDLVDVLAAYLGATTHSAIAAPHALTAPLLPQAAPGSPKATR
jgi:serine-type D-Ala-D-Ala carboxypeptidase/endopeptidase (penicillin-binding protein 4)